MKTKDLLRQLKTKDIAVFGTGFVAEMFYEALQIHDLTSKIRCFVVSQASQNQRLHDRPVYPAEGLDLPAGVLLCVAVHESAAKEVMQTLKAYADRTVWIYPNLLELLYGMPPFTASRQPPCGGSDRRKSWPIPYRRRAFTATVRSAWTIPAGSSTDSTGYVAQRICAWRASPLRFIPRRPSSTGYWGIKTGCRKGSSSTRAFQRKRSCFCGKPGTR